MKDQIDLPQKGQNRNSDFKGLPQWEQLRLAALFEA